MPRRKTVCVQDKPIHVPVNGKRHSHSACQYVRLQPDVLAYTKCEVQLTNVAPEDGLIQSQNM